MLFSRDDVAGFINENFESAWESVRPVPVVRIDFGNGTAVTRTLHGNIATYVCTAEGQVLDVLPGIYQPTAYRARLTHLLFLANYAQLHPADARAAFVKEYHRRLAAAQPAPAPAVPKRQDLTKTIAIEDPLEFLVRTGRPGALTAEPPPPPAGSKARSDVTKRDGVERPVEAVVRAAGNPPTAQAPPADLADWKLLAEDTRRNEVDRRPLIHAMLAAAGLVRPEAVTRRIYKDVLHADPDDPYLGLGPMLFGSYPFGKEDGR